MGRGVVLMNEMNRSQIRQPFKSHSNSDFKRRTATKEGQCWKQPVQTYLGNKTKEWVISKPTGGNKIDIGVEQKMKKLVTLGWPGVET